MQVVPVLDIKNALVVRGVMGDRASYRPIVTPLSPGPEPLPVARGLMALHPFEALYIADLDAIEGLAGSEAGEGGPADDRPSCGDAAGAPATRRRRGEPDAALVERLLAAHPGVTLWLDAGVTNLGEAMRIAAMPGTRVVVGSESIDAAPSLRNLSGSADFALSLDFRGETFLGPAEILADDSLWPQTLIVMTLAKVGSGAGPDLERLQAVKARAGDRRIFAAGGVRGPADLETLAAMGISGALVATALPDGRITAADLAALDTPAMRR
ncbi:MAG: nickel transporter [Fulvimarina sp.]|nr:nickel transporter [Fulvimarina sp.]